MIESLFEDVIVDFILNGNKEGNKRISFSYSRQEFYQINKNKSKGDSVDLLHNEIQFRVSAATETTVSSTQLALVQHLAEQRDNIQQIRVKQRKSMRFEMFQFDTSKVVTIEKKHSESMNLMKDTLADMCIDEEIVLDSLNHQIQQMVLDTEKQPLNTKYEIELEIVDLGYLYSFLEAKRHAEIASLVKRFLRNIESVVFIQRMVQKHLMGGVMPVIGQYLMETMAVL